jgi:hypothetical protein
MVNKSQHPGGCYWLCFEKIQYAAIYDPYAHQRTK